MRVFLIGLAFLCQHQILRQPVRRAGEIDQSGSGLVIEVPAVAGVDEMILGLLQRALRVAEMLRELSRAKAAESLGNVARSGCARIADLVAKPEVPRRGSGFGHVEDFALELMRQLPAHQLVKVARAATHSDARRTSPAKPERTQMLNNPCGTARRMFQFANRGSPLPGPSRYEARSRYPAPSRSPRHLRDPPGTLAIPPAPSRSA